MLCMNFKTNLGFGMLDPGRSRGVFGTVPTLDPGDHEGGIGECAILAEM